MTTIAYSVIATLPSEDLALEYVAWLRGGHVDAVLGHGAHSAMIVEIDDPKPASAARQVETRYIFSTREAFETYIAQHAPKLRSEGLARFGARGVVFERRTGRVL